MVILIHFCFGKNDIDSWKFSRRIGWVVARNTITSNSKDFEYGIDTSLCRICILLRAIHLVLSQNCILIFATHTCRTKYFAFIEKDSKCFDYIKKMVFYRGNWHSLFVCWFSDVETYISSLKMNVANCATTSFPSRRFIVYNIRGID